MTDQEFSELWTSLVDRNSGSATPPLTREERLFYAVNLLRGSVPRSGFVGYFENFTGREIHEAYEGLKELHLDAVLLVLQQAQDIVLGSKSLPNNELPVQVFDDSLTEKEYEELSGQLDAAMRPVEEKLYKLDNEIWQALCQFAGQWILKKPGG